jgi:DNA-binding protein HU-beta
MNEKELIPNIVSKTGVETEIVEKVFDTAIEQIVQSLKRCESVTIRNFGRFYIRAGRHSSSMVFKFSPSQRLRKILGWSSTYKGKI